ncbi:Oidioi.mRNA.OKI2018_I69.chr2.g6585.t1.cds [Oikopleura dioica]|uniref:Oidioi.mRNA.OKI2018_I69.chr2.g6585.t1.cds n=1 Tax=Oikopleura dioica TaxID=34765 RepID=A0ABN7T5T0_OIKDI|nr:Oidioi.mRNA.OKI2018_I69.chr2.g6585.t1.cds [Oikopleura dioica]
MIKYYIPPKTFKCILTAHLFLNKIDNAQQNNPPLVGNNEEKCRIIINSRLKSTCSYDYYVCHMMSYDGGYGSFGGGAAPAGEADYSGGATSYGAGAGGASAQDAGGYGAPAASGGGYNTGGAQGGYGGGYGGGQGGNAPQAAIQIKSNPKDGQLINSPDSPNNQKMFIGGVSKQTTTASLRAHFEQFGAVKDVEIKVDPSTGLSRGFGFVLFELPESVNAVVAAGQQFLDGKRIDPKPAEKRNCKVFIGGINPATASETVQELMETFGEVENFERRTDRNRGTLQPFAFCTFKDDAVASSLAKTRWVEIEGKRCEVKLSIENKQKLFNQGYGGNRGGYGGGGYGQQGYGGYGGFGGGGYGQQGNGGFGGYGGYGGPGFGGQQGGFGGPGGFRGAPGGRGGGPMRGGRGGGRGAGRPSPY